MTPAEFIAESLTFPVGTLTVMSGPDLDATLDLLQDAAMAIDLLPGKQALVYDWLATTIYPQRWYVKDSEEAKLWEFIKINSGGTFVVLVGNEFDPDNQEHNPQPTFLEADVVIDLMNPRRIQRALARESGLKIPLAHSRLYGIREIFAFTNRIYYFDGASVTFVKSQTPIL